MGDAVQTEGHALLKAVSQGKLRLARLLLEGGAYINEGNDRGETALSAACTARYQDPHLRPRMVRYLLDQGADPNMTDTAGRTAIMHAVHQRAGVHVVSLLMKHGADPSLKDYSGESALTLALVHTLQEDHLNTDQDHLNPDQDPQSPPETRDQSKTTDQSKTRDSPDRATLQLLLEACESRGQEVLILTCCWSQGHRTVRQFHHTPPKHHHLHHLSTAPERPPLNHRRPPHNQNQSQSRISVNGLAPEPPPGSALSMSDSTLSAEDHALSMADPSPSVANPAPSFPAPTPVPIHSSEPLSAASPSDVYVANANANEGVFSFSVASRPRPPRPHRVLKRLNSEPWGLTAARPALPQPPPQDEKAEPVKTPSLADCPQRRHSIETHDPGLGDQLTDKLKLTDELTGKLTQELFLTDEQKQEQNDESMNPNCTEKLAAEEDCAQTWRRRFIIPSPLPLATRGSSENLSSSPLATRRGRQGVGLLERRGSGTLLLDHLSQPRPGFLPPLFNQRPITDLRVANPASCAANANSANCANSANSANPKRELRKKKLLRRHSMQPEQMKLLSVFQQVLSENEEK